MGTPTDILTPEHAKVFEKGWYEHGDKKMYPGGWLQYWTPPTAGLVSFDGIERDLHFTYTDDAPPDVLRYQDELPSGPYWQWQAETGGAVVWTDGSCKDMGPEKGKRVGYGTYSQTADLNLSGRVGGEAVPIRGEFAAIAVALQHTPTHRPLAILSDCLSALQVLCRWRRRDFRPMVEDELHWDIVSDILGKLRERELVGAPTLMVWVKAHRGDPGNTRADRAADLGCELDEEEEVLYRRATFPLEVYDRFTGSLLSRNGWTAAVETQGRRYQGGLSAARLRSDSQPAKSTVSLLRPDADKALVSSILQQRGKGALPTQAVRDFIQMIGNAFPVHKVVARNTKGAVNKKCPFCHCDEESYSHMQASCEKNKPLRMEVHNDIVQTLTAQLQRLCKRVTVHNELPVGDFVHCEDRTLARYQPDAIVEFEKDHQRYVVVVEFTRSFGEEPAEQRSKIAEKQMAYRGAVRQIQRQVGKGTIVLHQTYVMSCHGVILAQDWQDQLAFWGLKEAEIKQVKIACLRACILGNHKIASARRARIEENNTAAGGPAVAPGPALAHPPVGVG